MAIRAGAKAWGAGLALALALAVMIWGPWRTTPAPPQAVVAIPEPVQETTPDPAGVLAPMPPRFDLVRVDGAGLATVAGSAPAGASVGLYLDGVEVLRAEADAGGQFAGLVSLSPSEAPRMLSLVARLADGSDLAGVETVAIGPILPPAPVPESSPESSSEATPETAPETAPESAPETAAETAPAEPAPPPLLLVSEGAAQVLTPAAPEHAGPAAAVSIDAITYGPAGEVLLAGRAAPGAALRIYLDDAPVAEVRADGGTGDGAGRWQAVLPEVAAGLHRLRADEVGEGGAVLSRFETPFQRDLPVVVPAAAPADPAPAPGPAPITITVQPGLTLWAIARENFGDGVMYVQVFEANRDKIKDPDLIYPGQVFTVPKP